MLAEGFRVETTAPVGSGTNVYDVCTNLRLCRGIPKRWLAGHQEWWLPETKESWPLKMLASIPLKYEEDMIFLTQTDTAEAAG